MFKILVFAATMLAAVSVFAGVTFGVNFESGYVDGVGKIKIMQSNDGKLFVEWDKNTCAPGGGACTRMAFGGVTVDPKVINDARGSDGDLLLELTPAINLSVSAGFTPDYVIDYLAIVKLDNGKTAKVPMKPSVYTITK